jgi:hypothetical protein
MIYYAAGSVPISKLYDIQAERERQTEVLGAPFPVDGGAMPFNHAPFLVPLLHLLIDGDFVSSYFRWTTLLWFIALVCTIVVYRMSGDLALTFAVGSFYPFFAAVMLGHDTVFVLLGVLLCAYLLRERRDVLAGIALSLATLKPHFAIFLAIPLIARPKAFFGFCTASAVLALYSVLLVGAQGVSDFLTLLRINAGGEVFGVHPLAMFNLLGLMERTGVSPGVARPVSWVIFFLAAALMLVFWKRNPLIPPMALTVLLAVITSPHLHKHDLTLLIVTFVSLMKPYHLILLASSVALGVLTIFAIRWQFAAACTLMAALLILSVRDAQARGSKTFDDALSE